jgi:nickel-dependent lactate racemase
MHIDLATDSNQSLELDVADEALVANCSGPHGEAVADVQALTSKALLEPVDFPPLRSAMVPGDCVAITLDDGVPQVELVVAAIVDELLEADIEPGDIELVQTPAAAEHGAPDPRSALSDSLAKQVRLSTHDPAERENLGYMAASTANRPVYFNRALHDADMVVVVGCLRLDASLGYHGVHGTLFPAFADEESQQRFRSPAAAESPVQQQVHRAEAEEASWLLGAMFTVQVLPGSRDTVLDVVAGQMKAVIDCGGEICRKAWQHQVPQRADLVIASISSASLKPTWDDFARALATAASAVDEGGAIALCGQLAKPPGPALQRLSAADHAEEELRSLIHDRPVDVLVANQLAAALGHARVYLLSNLSQDIVEQLGMAYIESTDELNRLIARHDACLILADAHYAGVTVAE